MPSTAAEQYELELIDEARLDPLASVARYVTSFAPLVSPQADIQDALTYFGVSGSALQAALAALAPAQPLAFDDSLASAARQHTAAMIAADAQLHQLPGETDLGTRISAQGYAFSSAGENVYAYADDPLYAQAGFLIDRGIDRLEWFDKAMDVERKLADPGREGEAGGRRGRAVRQRRRDEAKLAGGCTLNVLAVIKALIAGKMDWGINLSKVACPKCGTRQPRMRWPTNTRRALWGGWTCRSCSCEMDKWGREIADDQG